MFGSWLCRGICLSTDSAGTRTTSTGLCAYVSGHIGRNPADRHLYEFVDRWKL